MSFEQRGDVLCYITPDGIEVNFENGLIEMGWIESHINMCLCGGNKDDNVTPDTEKYEWMGNEDEEPAYRFRSRFISMFHGRPINSQLAYDLAGAAALDIADGSGDELDSVVCNVSIDSSTKITLKSNMRFKDGTTVSAENEFYK